MNFFFDLINHIAGYTDKYYDEHRDKIDHEGLVTKYRAEKDAFDGKIQESPLLGDRHPHCLLVLESV